MRVEQLFDETGSICHRCCAGDDLSPGMLRSILNKAGLKRDPPEEARVSHYLVVMERTTTGYGVYVPEASSTAAFVTVAA